MADYTPAQIEAKRVVTNDLVVNRPLVERMGMSWQQFERVALNAFLANKQVAECVNLREALLTCIELGVLPDGRDAVINPYWSKRDGCYYGSVIPMIGGLTRLVRNAVPGIVLRVRVVYRGEFFQYEDGMAVKLVHRPDPEVDRSDENLVAAYATAIVPGALVRPDGTPEAEVEVMFRDELDKAKARSSNTSEYGPWSQHFSEMCKKTVQRRLCKRLPKKPGTPPADREDAVWQADEIAPAVQQRAIAAQAAPSEWDPYDDIDQTGQQPGPAREVQVERQPRDEPDGQQQQRRQQRDERQQRRQDPPPQEPPPPDEPPFDPGPQPDPGGWDDSPF